MLQARRVPTDDELVAGLKAGGHAALEEMVRRYEARVFSLARGMTRNESDARDVLQDTFLSVFRKIRSFKGRSSLSTWIYRVAVNAALMTIRRRGGRDRSLSLDEYMPQFEATGHLASNWPARTPRADEALLRGELAGQIRAAIQDLPPAYRVVFALREQEGLSTAETARILKITVPSVKTRLHRARLYLRERLRRYLGDTAPRPRPS